MATTPIGRGLVKLNELLIDIFPGFFSYQIFVKAQANPTVKTLLTETITASDLLRKQQVA